MSGEKTRSSFALRLRIAASAGGVIGLVMLVTALIVGDVREVKASETQWLLALWIAGLLFLLVGLVGKAGALRRSLARRQTAIGANSAVMCALAVLLTVFLINISERRFMRIDMTMSRRHSLSTATIRYVRRLREPVHVTVLYNPKTELGFRLRPMIEDTLSGYESHSRRITVDRINVYDPENAAAVADLAGRLKGTQLASDNNVIFELGDRFKVVSFSETIEQTPWVRGSTPKYKAEDVFTSALYSLVEGEEKRVYAVRGHGEAPLRVPETDKADKQTALREQLTLSLLVETLRQDNFRVEPLSLLEVDAIPADAQALMIAGPKAPFRQEELNMLRGWLRDGGRLLVMVDAAPGERARTNVDSLLQDYGIDVRLDAFASHVYTSRRGGLTLTGAPVGRMVRHPVTTDLYGYNLDFLLACVLQVNEPGPDALEALPILFSAPSVWGETGEQRGYQTGEDIRGPVVVGAVVQARQGVVSEGAGPRIIVFSSVSSFENAFVKRSPAMLFLARNAVNWLTGSEAKIGIPPKSIDVREAIVSKAAARTSKWLALCILPLLIVTFGIFVWQLRRVH